MLAHASGATADPYESIGRDSQSLYEHFEPVPPRPSPGPNPLSNSLLLGSRFWLFDVAQRPRDREKGQQHDLDVEPQRPVLDVVVVPLDPVGERCLATEPVYLRPAGDAG